MTYIRVWQRRCNIQITGVPDDENHSGPKQILKAVIQKNFFIMKLLIKKSTICI